MKRMIIPRSWMVPVTKDAVTKYLEKVDAARKEIERRRTK